MSDTIAALDPKRTALLVMDYQQGIVGMLPEPDPLLARAVEALDAARAAGVRVGYVRVAFTEADVAAMPETNKMKARVRDGGDMLRDDAAATQIHPAVAPRAGDIIVRKTRVGPFLTPTSTSSCAVTASTRCCSPASARAASCFPPCATAQIATTVCSSSRTHVQTRSRACTSF